MLLNDDGVWMYVLLCSARCESVERTCSLLFCLECRNLDLILYFKSCSESGQTLISLPIDKPVVAITLKEQVAPHFKLLKIVAKWSVNRLQKHRHSCLKWYAAKALKRFQENNWMRSECQFGYSQKPVHQFQTFSYFLKPFFLLLEWPLCYPAVIDGNFVIKIF